MNSPTKDNKHIFSEPDAFREAYERARETFSQIEGVTGVGFGSKETGGEFTDDVAIVVFVREKKNDEELAPAERIPPTFEGYPTDVRVIQQTVPETCDNEAKYDKLQGGIQIAVRGTDSAGTLSCIVRRRGDKSRENVYLLTNKHVLYGPDFGEGDWVCHPTAKSKAIGKVQSNAFHTNVHYPTDSSAQQYFIDCAIAEIEIDCYCWGSRCTKDDIKFEEALVTDLQVNGVNSLGDVRSVIDDLSIIFAPENPRKVFKVGRTTGRTAGKVISVQAPPPNVIADPTKPNGPRIQAQNMIEIRFDVTSTANGLNCKGNPRFTEAGDSGALIIDENNRVIGIHSQGLPAGPGQPPSYACHIMPVLQSLMICIPTTTGTSHGSCLATDGSGIAPGSSGVGPGDFEVPDGQFGFASQVEAVSTRSNGSAPPIIPATDAEVERMLKLLDSFRETAKGRELHETFNQVRREIAQLVRHSRPVKVAWHRNHGPAFFAYVLNHLEGHIDEVPHEFKGVSRLTLLTRMAEVLKQHGSDPLRRAIAEYGEEFLEVMVKANNAPDCIEFLREKEMA